MQLKKRCFHLVAIGVACGIPLKLDTYHAAPHVPLKNEIVVTDVGLAGKGSAITLPDFTGYTDIQEKKAAFISFVLPLIEEQNRHILLQRQQLITFRFKLLLNEPLSTADRLSLETIASEYDVYMDSTQALDAVNTLLQRVDVIPASLALSQAVTESGWGTSRYASELNNLFGHYYPVGHHPVSRKPSGQKPAAFQSPAEAVAKYFRNLNTHAAYREMRRIRLELRQANQEVTGLALSKGLVRYSERGHHYLRDLAHIIRINDFDLLDQNNG